MKTIIRVYRRKTPSAKKWQWRWRMNDYRNGKVIAAATEGYDSLRGALSNLQRVVGVSFNFRLGSEKVFDLGDRICL